MARFTGKRVLITGGTSGIGLAGARRVTTEGGQLVLTGTNQQRLADMQEALPDAQVLRNDASDPSAANALADSVAAGGGLDGLWLNAGYAAVAGADEVDTDYVTREGLARAIAGEFWSKIEKIAPDQRTLNIPQEVYDQWREGIRLRKDGKPRVDGGTGLPLPVRAFYMDIQNWALEEPERWARWAAPCPIPPADLRGFGARRRRINERTADRVRERQPLLPALVAHVEERYTGLRALLEAARATSLGETFTHDGRTYSRMNARPDQRHHDDPQFPLLRARDQETGQVRALSDEEETAFWEWAYVEVLRHTGVRIEELVELAHTGIRQYQRPHGEVIALLVIAPSKTNRERVIPMSAELFHVIAMIVLRQTALGPIPLVPRYDGHERVWTAPMPYLFQRQIGGVRRVTSTGTILNNLRRRCQILGETTQRSAGCTSPHTTSAGCSPPIWSTTGYPSTSAQPCSATSTSKPRKATSPCSKKTSSATPKISSRAVAPCAPRGVPAGHRPGVARIRGTLRQAQGRGRLVWSTLRNQLPARTRLPALRTATRQPKDAAPTRRTGKRPDRPPQPRGSRSMARRDRGNRPDAPVPARQARRRPAADPPHPPGPPRDACHRHSPITVPVKRPLRGAVSTDHRNTAETVWWCAAGAAAAVGVAVVVGGAGGDLAWLGRGSVVPGDRDRVGPLTLDGQPRGHG